MKLDSKVIKTLGMVATVAGFGLTLIQTYVEDTKRNETIKEEVKLQLQELNRESE